VPVCRKGQEKKTAVAKHVSGRGGGLKYTEKKPKRGGPFPAEKGGGGGGGGGGSGGVGGGPGGPRELGRGNWPLLFLA